MPAGTLTVNVTEGRQPATTKDQLIQGVLHVVSLIEQSEKKVTYVRTELVNDELRWKIVETS